MSIRTDRANNLTAAGSYLTSLVERLDELESSCRARSVAQNDFLFMELHEVVGALTKYLVNLQMALELNNNFGAAQDLERDE